MDLQEKILLNQLKLSDDKAFTTLYNKYWFTLYNQARRKLKSNEVAEEIVHDIFLDFWARRKSIEINTSLEAYLYQSVRYSIYKYIKSLKSRDAFIAEMVEEITKNELNFSSYQSEYGELNESLRLSIKNLPARCRQVFELSRLDQLSHKEIAQKLLIDVKTVENQITKAIKVLKISLRDYTLLLAVMFFS